MPDFASQDDRHKYILDHVEYFTAVVFLGVGKYYRVEVATEELARHAADSMSEFTQRPVMIYAVSGLSDSLVAVVKPKEKLSSGEADRATGSAG